MRDAFKDADERIIAAGEPKRNLAGRNEAVIQMRQDDLPMDLVTKYTGLREDEIIEGAEFLLRKIR